MTDELSNEIEFESDLTTDTLDMISGTLENFLSAATVDSVYGKPVKSGDTLIIPTAEVLSAVGFGLGGGSGSGPVTMEAGQGDQVESVAGETVQAGGTGVGGGGGGRVLTRPVVIVVASPQGVRVEPIVDITKLGLAFLTAIGFMIGVLARMRR